MDHRRQRKVQRPKPQNGEDVGRIDDVGIGRDGEDRRHRIHGEDDVSELDRHQGQEQRRGVPDHSSGRIRLTHEEPRAVQGVSHRHAPPQPLDHALACRGLLPGAGGDHSASGEDEEGGKDIERPLIAADQGRPRRDHHRPQDDDPQNAPEQHPVLMQAWNAESGENQCDDEDIVHRQALFDGEAGQVVQPAVRPQPHPDPDPEQQGDRDVKARQQQAFPHPDLMRLAVQDAQVEGQQGDHDHQKARPHPRGLAHPLDRQEFHRRL
ncbi:hypothetical protein D3C85_1057950 [compost metagenome]